MGFFTKVYVEKKDGTVVDITELDKKHYEAFLDFTKRLERRYRELILEEEKAF